MTPSYPNGLAMRDERRPRKGGAFLLALCAILTLNACSMQRAPTGLYAAGTVQDRDETTPIFLSTNRKRTDAAGGPFTADRSLALSFARFDVSAPANRALGQVPVGGNDPKRRFTAVYHDIDSRAQIIAQINATLERLPPQDREIFIFVHGYNNNISESLFRAAQIVSDFDIQSVPLHYAWPSAGSLPLYVFDRDSAIFARDGLADTIELAAQTKAKDIVLVAHSMGAFVAMEALRTLALRGKSRYFKRFGGVVLAAPDIDVDVFKGQVHDIGTLPSPFTILISQRDRAIGLSRFLAGGHPRVGNVDDIALLQRSGITVIDVSKVDGGGHTVFAQSETMTRLVENNRISHNALVTGQTQAAPIDFAEAVASSAIALPLTVFLPDGRRFTGNETGR